MRGSFCAEGQRCCIYLHLLSNKLSGNSGRSCKANAAVWTNSVLLTISQPTFLRTVSILSSILGGAGNGHFTRGSLPKFYLYFSLSPWAACKNYRTILDSITLTTVYQTYKSKTSSDITNGGSQPQCENYYPITGWWGTPATSSQFARQGVRTAAGRSASAAHHHVRSLLSSAQPLVSGPSWA
jgi:hypothetical protein